MSEHFTHIAIYEDVMRMCLPSPEICEAFKVCIQNHYDSGLMGSGTRGNHIFAVPILEAYKDQWDPVRDDTNVQIQIAYAIGWLAHRAADRRLKLVFAAAEEDPNPAFSNDSCRVQTTYYYRCSNLARRAVSLPDRSSGCSAALPGHQPHGAFEIVMSQEVESEEQTFSPLNELL